MDCILRLASDFVADADRLDPYNAGAAAAFRDAARRLEALARERREERLSLTEAAAASGYSVDHLRHMVAEGRIPNAGAKGTPRIRRGELPRRVRKAEATGYDPTKDALSIVGRRSSAGGK